MLRLLGKKIIAFLRKKILLNWTYGRLFLISSMKTYEKVLKILEFIKSVGAQASLHICADFPEPWFLTYTKYGCI